MNRPEILILSRNYSNGLAVARMLGSVGFAVDMIASSYKPGASDVAACSKYIRSFSEVVSKKVGGDNGDEELTAEILKHADINGRKKILIPTDDYTTTVMDNNRDALSASFDMPYLRGGVQGDLAALMDKTVQAEMAKAVGLEVAAYWTFDLRRDIEIPEDMMYPCYCKPVKSIIGYKTEMAVCGSENELRLKLEEMQASYSDRTILVQEYLNIEYEIASAGLCLDEHIVLPGLIRKTRVGKHGTGVTLTGELVPNDILGSDTAEKAIELLKSFHYTGMFGMEFAFANGKFYFNEVNLRSAGETFAYYHNGVNLAELYVKGLLGESFPTEDEQMNAYGKTLIYDKIAWEDHIHGYITKEELDECIKTSDFAILMNDDDPAPGELFLKQAREQLQKNRRRHIKRDVIAPVLRPVKQWLLGYPQTRAKNRRDPQSPLPRVLVAGRNYCSNLCMARSLGEAGYEVEVLRLFQSKPGKKDYMRKPLPEAYSKYVKAYYPFVTRRKDRRIVEKLIEIADRDHKILIVPVDDLVAAVIDENYDELSRYYLMPSVNGCGGGVSALMRKGVQKELADKAGLPVLNSCTIKTEDGNFEIPGSVKYPCFVKPNVSKDSYKHNMRICGCREELEKALAELSEKKDISVLVEDYADIVKEYSLLGLSTTDGVVSPGFFGMDEGGRDEHRGVALTGSLLDINEHRELVDRLNIFVASLGFNGLFDIDLAETADGKMYFLEINMRSGASGYVLTKCGVNLPGMFADYMIKGEIPDFDASVGSGGATFVSERVLIDEYAGGRIDMDKVSECMAKADVHFIKSDDDPKPYRHFRRFYRKADELRSQHK